MDIEVREDELVIRPVKKPRKGWAEAFRSMSEENDDMLLEINDKSIKNCWDDEEWE